MAFTFDPATDRGTVRLLIADDVEQYDGEDVYHFTDEKIDRFLTVAENMRGDTVFNAASLALEAWASNELAVLKVATQLDTQTDGASVSREMRMRAKEYRAIAAEADDDAGFVIAEMYVGEFSWREQVLNKAINDA